MISLSRSKSPPPTRGWTRSRTRPRSSRHVSPAHAGMDLRVLGPQALADRLPRPRGDGPDRQLEQLPQFGLPRPRGDGPPPRTRWWRRWSSPPPTRGWTCGRKISSRTTGVSPAHAGMDPPPSSPTPAPTCLPRPRGDGPRMRRLVTKKAMSPPPTRGWTRPGRTVPPAPSVSPAHAGMDPRQVADPDGRMRLPRPRGDGPTRRTAMRAVHWSPPPTRGWTRPARLELSKRTVSPAHAGMDPRRCGPRWPPRGLPRPRGDGPASGRIWQGDPDVSLAHAGMDPRAHPTGVRRSSLPRPRGDGPMAPTPAAIAARSPPPTRGWTRLAALVEILRTVSPAHAGMDPARPCAQSSAGSLPRPRGDGPTPEANATTDASSPPPTRGWTHEV